MKRELARRKRLMRRSCREMVSKRTIMWRGKVRSGGSVEKTKRGKRSAETEREEPLYSSNKNEIENAGQHVLDENDSAFSFSGNTITIYCLSFAQMLLVGKIYSVLIILFCCVKFRNFSWNSGHCWIWQINPCKRILYLNLANSYNCKLFSNCWWL